MLFRGKKNGNVNAFQYDFDAYIAVSLR